MKMYFLLLSVLIYNCRRAIFGNSVKIKDSIELQQMWNFIDKYIFINRKLISYIFIINLQ